MLVLLKMTIQKKLETVKSMTTALEVTAALSLMMLQVMLNRLVRYTYQPNFSDTNAGL